MPHVYVATCENEWESRSTVILGVAASLAGAWALIVSDAPELASEAPTSDYDALVWSVDRGNPYLFRIDKLTLLP